MNNEIEEWIFTALAEKGLSHRKMSVQESAAIVNRGKDKFVFGNPRSWWLSLKVVPEQHSSGDTVISSFVSDGSLGWFIPETENERLPVYRLSAKEAEWLIQECPFFEYYFLNEGFSILVIENDHDEFLVCRE
jgi:hypothetical protein